jgi:hypothetical protein
VGNNKTASGLGAGSRLPPLQIMVSSVVWGGEGLLGQKFEKHRPKNRPKRLFRPALILPFRVKISICKELYGAGYKIRTRDPLITNQYISLFYRTPDFPILVFFLEKSTYFRGFSDHGVKSVIDAV